MVKINISIDGPSSSGKSSIAASLASLLSYKYVNTGSMYRAVTYFCLRENIFENKFCHNKLKMVLSKMKLDYSYNNKTKRSILIINGKDVSKYLNTIDVTDNVSFVSKIKEVRLKLIEIQRNYAKDKGVVMEGRDIGTVVLPNADVKFFIQAENANAMSLSPERAQYQYYIYAKEQPIITNTNLILIYPNPSQSGITIENNFSESTNFTIFSSIGQIVKQGQINSSLFYVDISQLAANIYFLKIGTSQEFRRKKR